MNDLLIPPVVRPARPYFSSGPCAKRPGWSLENLNDACVGRSHRSGPGKAKLAEAIDRTRALLGIPDDYRIGIVPASDTGAMEMAMWSLLGARGVDILAWESFGSGWVTDVTKQLRLEDVRLFEADYGALPALADTSPDRDIIFTWNGTTSGVCVPDGNWISPDRAGLTLCDATSAVFAMALPWDKFDVTTFSWQKVMGGEAAHGMLVLSPRAVERLETYTPPWPMPKIFRLTKGGKLIDGVFRGETINTPSMLCVEDYIDALIWGDSLGGLPALIGRAQGNLDAIADWVAQSRWAGFLATDPATRSCTSICLKITDPWAQSLDDKQQAALPKAVATLLSEQGVALDIGGYRDAPPGLRIWGGATIDLADITALLPWLDWAYGTVALEMGRPADSAA